MTAIQISSPSVPAPNIEFTRLNPYISIYTPPTPPRSSSQPPPSPSDPSIILICQWMGASPRSRALQTLYQRYSTLYPTAQILSLRSVPAFFMTTATGTRLGYFEPVVDVLENVLYGGHGDGVSGRSEEGERNGKGGRETRGRVLVHVFSNGGGLTFWDVCSLWKTRRQQRGTRKEIGNSADGGPTGGFDIQALVLDSCPGAPGAKEGWEAMKVGLPKGFMWWFGAASIWAVIGWMWVWTSVVGGKTLVDQMRRGLNDANVVDRRAKRLYVYSAVDKLVNFKVVERHIEEAREMGIEVTTLKEENTPHVQHMIKDEKRYWMKVEELWDSTKG